MLSRPYKVKHYKAVGMIAVILSGIMAVLYLIPNSGCTFVGQELFIAVIWCILGITFACLSKKRYGELFGITELDEVDS